MFSLAKLAESRTSYMARTLVASGSLLSLLATNATMLPPVYAEAAPRKSSSPSQEAEKIAFQGSGSGTLTAMLSTGKPAGQCPLKHTSVTAKISGYVSRVTVKQTFANPFKDKIEATYTFPLSETGAVDSMVMKVGNRVIKGSIKKREEAKEIYDKAKAQGHVASLLDQERPNIFTQSVANIEPGKEVEITIQYVDLLPFEDGKYTFAFPTVVGPRFNPGNTAIGKTGTGWSPDTDMVPDASKITPPVTPEGTRAGHDISIRVELDSGIPISNISSKLHQVNVLDNTGSHAVVELAGKATIPNKDFVLSWDVAGEDLKSGYLTHWDSKEKSGYFTLMLVPPKRLDVSKVAPKEMIFLIDCSGSQSGKPLEKAKETLDYVLDHMNPQDTFQIISFNNNATSLFNEPQQATPQMRNRARDHIRGLEARGGTWMRPAVEEACKIAADKNRLRIVCFMTDGYVGNDMEVLSVIKNARERSRWFPFGTGNSVNRFLIDGIAKEGGGEAEYVLLNTQAGVVGKKFYDRISTPVLTDVKVAFNGVEVKEVFPKEVNDVWAQKPLYFKGRYTAPGAGTVTLSGFRAGQPYKETLKVNFGNATTNNPGIASTWARAKVDRLMSEDWMGAQSGNPNKEIKEEIVATALKHHIMTQYTSFVAVEEKTVTKDGVIKQVTVPIEMPDGVSREGVFGERGPILQGATNGPIGSLGGFPASGRFNYARQSYSHFAPGAMATRGGGGGFAGGKGSSGYYNQAAPAPTPPGLPSVNWGKSIQASGDSMYMDAKKAKAQIVTKTESPKEDRDELQSKLHARLRDIEKRFDQLGDGVPNVKIEGGKLFVKVTLTDSNKETLALLKQCGLESISSVTISGSQHIVSGKIKVELLKKLAALTQVKLIAPAD